jgi:hypothetical protein
VYGIQNSKNWASVSDVMNSESHLVFVLRQKPPAG